MLAVVACGIITALAIYKRGEKGLAALVLNSEMLHMLQPITSDGNDHTNMTAPLPVRSAKLSMFGPG
eukprot:scaffold5159_cov112-Cylindrotheca_fusiformis.AAC.10